MWHLIKNTLALKERAEGVVEDREFLLYAIENFTDYQNMSVTPLVFSASPVFLGLSRKSPFFSRRAEIEQAILELQKEELWPVILY